MRYRLPTTRSPRSPPMPDPPELYPYDPARADVATVPCPLAVTCPAWAADLKALFRIEVRGAGRGVPRFSALGSPGLPFIQTPPTDAHAPLRSDAPNPRSRLTPERTPMLSRRRLDDRTADRHGAATRSRRRHVWRGGNRAERGSRARLAHAHLVVRVPHQRWSTVLGTSRAWRSPHAHPSRRCCLYRRTVTPHGCASSVVCTTSLCHEDSPSSANPTQHHPRGASAEVQAALTVTRRVSNASQGPLVTEPSSLRQYVARPPKRCCACLPYRSVQRHEPKERGYLCAPSGVPIRVSDVTCSEPASRRRGHTGACA